MAKTKQVFISYDSEDTQFAHRLANDLQRLGVQVWIAPESIRPGESWVSAIERGLKESSHVVVVLTPAALESEWVKKETDVAIAQERKGRIQVIPLDVESCEVPLLLSSYQMVSFRRNYDAGLSKLANILCMPIPETSEVSETSEVLPRPPTPQPFEPEMILIPAGKFLMGSDPSVDKDASNSEQPQHTLYLPDYYLAKTPVTQAQYAAFVQATGHNQPEHWEGGKPPRGKEDHPMVWVTWHDAVAYCNWMAETTGKPYRLPSEAEWEKGARGSDGRIYPWGNQWDAKRCNTLEGGKKGTTPVGAYPQGVSPYGLLDMTGNVREWTRSVYKGYPYVSGDGREDLESGDPRVLRGGSWRYYQVSARCAFRFGDLPDYRLSSFGFRVAASPGSP